MGRPAEEAECPYNSGVLCCGGECGRCGFGPEESRRRRRGVQKGLDVVRVNYGYVVGRAR